MRTSTGFPGLTRCVPPLLLVGGLAAPAHADRKEVQPIDKVVALAGRYAERTAASLATGTRGTTGAPAAPHREPFLSAREISAEVAPHAPEIEHCYLARLGEARGAGHLDVTFVIGRDGDVVSVSAAAPGLSARAVHQVASCIREAAGGLRFPERRNDTTAVVPYYFQRTDAPGAGPQLSCWNPQGC